MVYTNIETSYSISDVVSQSILAIFSGVLSNFSEVSRLAQVPMGGVGPIGKYHVVHSHDPLRQNRDR